MRFTAQSTRRATTVSAIATPASSESEMTTTIRRITGPFGRERMTVKAFKYKDDMYKFLNRGDNANQWREVEGFTPGTYASVAGEWINIRKLDEVTLAHV
jgi:hypothetical protein